MKYWINLFQIKKNWDNFRDVLRGGFGALEYNENTSVKVINFTFARKRIDKIFDKALTILEKNMNVELTSG